MALSFVAASEYESLSSSSALVTKPTGTSDGDIMFAVVYTFDAFSNSVPAGWTSLGQNPTTTNGRFAELFYKIASGEGTDYTWGFAAAGIRKVTMATYRGGFNSSSPIDVVSNSDYITSDATNRAASMNVSATNSPLLFFASAYKTSTGPTYTKPSTPTTDWVEDYDNGTTSSRIYNEICSMTWTGSGATGDMDATMTFSLVTKHAFAVALNPSTGGTSTVSPSTLLLMGVG